MKKILSFLSLALLSTGVLANGTSFPPGGAGGTPGGAANSIQYNNAGSFGGFVLSNDCTLTVGTGAIICTKTNGVAFATSATTDTTNATNISSGTLNTARLPSPFTSGTASGNTTKFATASGTLTSGNCVKFDASGNIVDSGGVCAAGGTAIKSITSQFFTTSGTYTPNANLVYAVVELVNGGAGGGGVKVATGTNSAAATGGSAGAYCKSIISAASIGASKAVTIGAAGTAGGNTGTGGGNGGATSLGVLVVGAVSTAGNGSTNATTGQVISVSQDNQCATADFKPVSQGSAAGFASSTALIGFGGAGGSSPWGAGGGGGVLSATGTAAGGSAQSLITWGGGGGGGAVSVTSTTGSVGGIGATGAMLITEYNSQ